MEITISLVAFAALVVTWMAAPASPPAARPTARPVEERLPAAA